MLFSSLKQPPAPSQHQSSPPTCYFSYTPSHATPVQHSPSDTPLCSPGGTVLSLDTPSEPGNPLLALRDPPTTTYRQPGMDAAKLLQLQTKAAYGASRPQPQPHQSSASSPGSDSSTNPSPTASSSSTNTIPQMLPPRCSRCHRNASLGELSPTGEGMISYGTNLYYCRRCAELVGFFR